MIVVTGSMEPTINIKEFVVIKEQEEYKVQDIVTYRDSYNNLVTHRIVSKVGDTIIARGDNNTLNDEPIKAERIEGKVCYQSLVIGEILLYWVKPILIFIIICLSLSFIKGIILTRKGQIDEEKN